jgi:phenylalanyl-tRNA synthetase beta chain
VYSKNPEIPLFYSAKNAVKDLLNQFNIKNIKYIPGQKGLPPYAHPARSLEIHIDNKFAGLVFEAHPGTMENFELKGKAALFDLNADIMFASAKTEKAFIELQKFPDVPFEISVLADKQKYAAEIRSIIEKSSREFIKSIEIISVYEGPPVPEGMKSVSFKIIFAAKDSTLSPEQIEKLQQKVIDDLKKNGLKLR